MEKSADKNILIRFNNASLQNTLREALSNARMTDYSRELVRGASMVVTDTGIEDGTEIAGYLPVVIIVDEDDARVNSYYTHELSPYELPETYQSEFMRFAQISEFAYGIALDDHPVVKYEALNELVAIGGYSVVRSGIDQFVRNTTLQLNECRSLVERNDLELVRYTLHAIQNNATNIGAVQLAVFAGAMEDALMSENYPNFDAMLELAYTLLASFDYVTRSWTEQSATA